jgi:hypothetical protein
MRNIIMLVVVLAITSTSFTSCTKEGATGQQGIPGINASTAFQLKFTVSNWTSLGSIGVPGVHLYAHIIDSSLAFASIGAGGVFVYSDYGTNGLQAWPFTYYSASGIKYDHQFNWYDGGVNVDIFASDYSIPTIQNYNITIVVIPGAHKRMPVDMNNYNAVIDYYHPKLIH